MAPPSFRLGCLHMHHSNIAYIGGIIPSRHVEALHFVDPGLMQRLSADPAIAPAAAQAQVRRQLAWMAECDLDAILITCTNYIAMLPDAPLDLPIPVLKIDEPFFAWLLTQPTPRLLLFTNPATVEGTLRRLHAVAAQRGDDPHLEVEVITGTFELLMAGRTAEYAAAVTARLRDIALAGRYHSLAVGQLSLADAARQVTAETGVTIGSPLAPLQAELARVLATASASG